MHVSQVHHIQEARYPTTKWGWKAQTLAMPVLCSMRWDKKCLIHAMDVPYRSSEIKHPNSVSHELKNNNIPNS